MAPALRLLAAKVLDEVFLCKLDRLVLDLPESGLAVAATMIHAPERREAIQSLSQGPRSLPMLLSDGLHETYDEAEVVQYV